MRPADFSTWRPWSPQQVVQMFDAVAAPWYIAGGWAIELFLGEHIRAHGDIEIGIASSRFSELAPALELYELYAPGSSNGDPIVRIIEPAARLAPPGHQTWVRDPVAGYWRLDVFREPSRGESWIYRRNPSIVLPYDELIHRTTDGVPYACPESVLLFKSKHRQRKDDVDFDAVLPSLAPSSRRRLDRWLGMVDPTHPWRAKL